MGWQGQPQRPQPKDTSQSEITSKPNKNTEESPPLYAKIIGGIILVLFFVGVVLPIFILVGRAVIEGLENLWGMALS